MTNNKNNGKTDITASDESGEGLGTERLAESRVDFNQDKEWAEVDNRITDLEKQTSKIEEKIDRFDEKIKDSNLKTIETLGIFVALFTFVSVEFQIFKDQVTFLAGLGFTLILLGSLLSFLWILRISVRENQSNDSMDNLTVFSWAFILIVAGIVAIGIEYSNFPPKLEENYYSKQEIDNKLNSLIDKFVE